MRELLIIAVCVSIPCLGLKGCQAYRNIQEMNAEIQQAHENGSKPCPLPASLGGPAPTADSDAGVQFVELVDAPAGR